MNSQQVLVQLNHMRNAIMTYQKVPRYYNNINSVCRNYHKAACYARKINDLSEALAQIDQFISNKKSYK